MTIDQCRRCGHERLDHDASSGDERQCLSPACGCPHYRMFDRTIFGNGWVSDGFSMDVNRCGDRCTLQVVRPGKFQCGQTDWNCHHAPEPDSPEFDAYLDRCAADATWHGTVGGYTNRRCRCGECRQAMSRYQDAYRATHALDPDDSRHGTNSAYTNYGCRCIRCTAAHSSVDRAYRRKELT